MSIIHILMYIIPRHIMHNLEEVLEEEDIMMALTIIVVKAISLVHEARIILKGYNSSFDQWHDNLHPREEFKGIDQLIIRNGQGLSITHVGHVFLSFKDSNCLARHSIIALKDMLLVPSVTKNPLVFLNSLLVILSLLNFVLIIFFMKNKRGQVFLQT